LEFLDYILIVIDTIEQFNYYTLSMKKSASFFLILMVTKFAVAQPEKESILNPINQLFTGMKAGDSALVRSVFSTNAILNGIDKDEKGNASVRKASLKTFLTAIGTPHKEVWNELVWDVTVQQDGELAQVWASYAFYRGTTFSHCGVDAFQLLKQGDGWKIIALLDTRRKENCNIPKQIADKFKER
jgi:hypothetical protein